MQVPDEILVQRVVGRRQDPATGKIYHLMYSPPETPVIAGRLTQRLDDTEEKVSFEIPQLLGIHQGYLLVACVLRLMLWPCAWMLW